jgi:hypothetical protein
MTSSLIERIDRREVVISGLILGAAPAFLGTAWGMLVSVCVLWSLFGKTEKRLSLGDLVRLVAAGLLAAVACDVLMHPVSFLEGVVEGWNAGSYLHAKS